MSQDISINAEYAGCAVQDGSDAVVAGKIKLDRWRLRFESETVTLEIPLVRLNIEVGEAAEGRVHFRHTEKPGWTVYTCEEEILTERALLGQTHTRNQIRDLCSGDEIKRRLKVTLWFLAGFGVLALILMLVMQAVAGAVVSRLPASWEKELGDKALAELRQTEIFSDDPKLKARVDEAVKPLLAGLPKVENEYKFYVLEERFPNAFALPGGHVLVTRGLLDLADRPEEVAGVVAHEIAHVTKRHGIRGIVSAVGPYILFRLLVRDEDSLAGLLGRSSQLLVRQSFSQKYEYEADDVGCDYLAAARLDPRSLPKMLGKLKQVYDRLPQDFQFQAFSSHPATDKRIRRLEAKCERLGAGLDLGRAGKKGVN